jgi:hypothetical protein
MSLSAKPCTTCDYYAEPDLCTNPRVQKVDVVKGTTAPPSCYHVRATDGACGPEARLWVGRRQDDPGLPERPESLPA